MKIKNYRCVCCVKRSESECAGVLPETQRLIPYVIEELFATELSAFAEVK